MHSSPNRQTGNIERLDGSLPCVGMADRRKFFFFAIDQDYVAARLLFYSGFHLSAREIDLSRPLLGKTDTTGLFAISVLIL